MKKLIISVGTTSSQKISYLKETLKELDIKSELIPVEVNSGVSEQPKTSTETKQGSINRAKRASKKELKVDFSVGIEVGYHKNSKDKYEMFCWVTIINDNGYIISNQSHKFLLPNFHQNLLDKDLYIGDNLDGYHINEKDFTRKYIDDIVRYRKPFIKIASKNALVSYIKREDF